MALQARLDLSGPEDRRTSVGPAERDAVDPVAGFDRAGLSPRPAVRLEGGGAPGSGLGALDLQAGHGKLVITTKPDRIGYCVSASNS